MFKRTAVSVIDVASLFRIAIFQDFRSTLLSYAVNVAFTLAAMLLMQRMHSEAYQVFYNFVTGALNPSVLIVMACLMIALIGVEFIVVGVTFFQKGYIPPLALRLIMSIRNSIVMQSGVTFALAVVMFASDPMSRWKAYATAVVYLASAYIVAFLGLAPFYLESNRIADRISLVAAGVGLLLLVWFWPDIFSPEVLRLKDIIG
jgi:hypothetical protein